MILEDSAAPEAPVEELPVFKRQSFAWQQRQGWDLRPKIKIAFRERLHRNLQKFLAVPPDIWNLQEGFVD